MLVLFVNFIGNDFIKSLVHLWYLLSLLEREKDGFHGYSNLVPGLILLRLFMCFWYDRICITLHVLSSFEILLCLIQSFSTLTEF